MFDTDILVRDRTQYTQLDDGSWQARFPGRKFIVTVTAATLEQARMDLMLALDVELFEFLCDDLGLAGDDRPKPHSTKFSEQLSGKGAQATQRATTGKTAAKGKRRSH